MYVFISRVYIYISWSRIAESCCDSVFNILRDHEF